MDFTEVVKRRRMCRSYLEREVTSEQLDLILDLATRFPSAGHTQPQEFIIVRDQSVKDALGEAAFGQMYLADARVVIVVVSDTKRSARRYGRRGVHFYSVVDGAFAAMLVLLAAVDAGLGAAFVAAFDDDQVGKVLRLPDHVRPIGIIPIGYCREAPERHPRRAREELFHYERWAQEGCKRNDAGNASEVE